MAENQKQVKVRKPKAKGKKYIKPVKAEGVKKLVPAFLYITECCGELGKKTPVVKRTQDEQKKSPQNLGSFRCTKCGRPAKVNRQTNTEGVEIGIA